MAFDRTQTKKAQAAVVIAALALAVVLLVAVLSGALSPRPVGTGAAPAGSSAAAAAPAPSSTGAAPGGESSAAEVDSSFGAAEQQLKAQYEADPSNPAALLNLANGYFDWGASAMGAATTDEQRARARELFNKAIDAYDTYLAEHPGSKGVIVDRAISIFYTGDTTRAIDELEAFTKEDDAFGPAWANLGMFYEGAGRTDDARAAYERAVEADPDNAYQVKTYAQQRLEALGK
ncbi:MAG: tetratricopeptide repeat protein [Coriobacteriaceae bacterium]|nr:tetratricopeptide repeat protein [Coriobacteriaceae bacterium]